MKRVVINLSIAALLGLGALAIQSANVTRPTDTVYASDQQDGVSTTAASRPPGCQNPRPSRVNKNC
jgi:hypothetical protein